MVTFQLRQMVVYPGEKIHLRDVNWAEFEAIVAELGDIENMFDRISMQF